MPRSFGSLRPPRGIKIRPKEDRATARQRGYDAAWDRLSLQVREEEGICQRCDFYGMVRPAEIVDHKMPTADGGEMMDRGNLWSLCQRCHSWKRELEAYARRNGHVHMLRIWCDDLDQVPQRFKPLR